MKSHYIYQVPEIAPILAGADHVDIKTCRSRQPMQEFIAGALSYQPAWMTALYAVRWGFVRLLGMKQQGLPKAHRFRPDEISLTPGDYATFFQVKAAQAERYWFAGITEAHLTAHLGVVVEPLAGQDKRFHVVTVVHYHRWTGPVYFNIIRPFHHVVVGRMVKAGLAGA
jgi:hypothetical protein